MESNSSIRERKGKRNEKRGVGGRMTYGGLRTETKGKRIGMRGCTKREDKERVREGGRVGAKCNKGKM